MLGDALMEGLRDDERVALAHGDAEPDAHVDDDCDALLETVSEEDATALADTEVRSDGSVDPSGDALGDKDAEGLCVDECVILNDMLTVGQ